jgi:hypothetical protein
MKDIKEMKRKIKDGYKINWDKNFHIQDNQYLVHMAKNLLLT